VADGYLAHLQSEAGALGLGDRMHFLGWRDDVPEVIAAADIVVLPSWSEGLPLAVLEAMACGKPVVATPVGGVARAVVEGKTGLLVPPGKPGRLAAAISRLLQDPVEAARMGAEGRRRVESRYSLDQFTRSIESLYDALLGRTQDRSTAAA